MPAGYGGTLAEAIPRLLQRFGEIPGELAAVTEEFAGLARRHDFEAGGGQPLGQPPDLGALACAFAAFECDEAAARHFCAPKTR